MIRKQHSRFIRNSFLAVCSILIVIFLITAVMMVRFVDSSIESELVSLIHFTSGGVVEEEEEPEPDPDEEKELDANGEPIRKEREDLAARLGLDGPRKATVGGTRFPTYLFQIWQSVPDPEADRVMPDDEILQIRGEQPYLEDSESWRALFDVMLKSKKRIDRIESEELCYTVDRSGTAIDIAIVDYSGYGRFLRRLALAGAGLIVAFAGAFYLLLRFSANNLLRPA